MRWLTSRSTAARRLTIMLGVVVTIVAAIAIAATVDPGVLSEAWRAAVSAPAATALVVLAYAVAFVLRAFAWIRVVPALRLRHALAALHVSLGANHLLPARLGEVFRVASVVHRAKVPLPVATASTVALRAVDLAAIVTLAIVLAPAVAFDVVGHWATALLTGAATLAILAGWWLVRMRREGDLVRAPDLVVVVLTVTSWLLEAAVMHQAAAWVDITLTPTQAMVVTAVTIAAQAVAIAPGGFGTYEAAATAALVAVAGADVSTALAAALAAHAFKTAYSLITGAVATSIPGPSMLGCTTPLRREPTAAMSAPSTASSAG